MTVTSVEKDLNALTLTVTADFAAPPDKVWELWADPRKLEKWWGPPTYPATFMQHDLTPGAVVTYYMTSPEGEKSYGGWRVVSVDEPNQFTFEDYFADAEFRPAEGMPVAQCVFAFEPAGDKTRATFTTTYPTVEALQRVLDMGMEEGATTATNQIDKLLATG